MVTTEAFARSNRAAAPDGGALADDLTLVWLMHEGVFEEQPWRTFLKALRHRVGAAYANIIFRRPGAPDEGLIEWADMDDPESAETMRQLYERSFMGQDPFPYFRMEPGKVQRLPDLMGKANYAADPYFLGFLKPNGLEFMLLFRAVEPKGHQAWLTLTRPYAGADFPDEAEALCTRLASHFAIALRTYSELEAAKVGREILKRVMRKLNFGYVAIDGQRGVVRGGDEVSFASRLDRLPLIIDAAGKVRIQNPAADRQLGQVLAQIETGGVSVPQIIVSESGEKLGMLVVPVSAVPQRSSGPIATIYFPLRDDEPALRDARQALLRELFTLSATEAALALRLAEGRTLAEAAEEIGITLESARTYSKRIFAKTGTSRQADLVRVILQSVASLA